MWQPTYIKSYNLSSFSEVEHNFTPECYVVQGINKSDDGQQSNGSGKTTFANILPILVLGQSLEGTSLKDLVNWKGDEKSFTVEGELKNSFTKQTLWIKRIAYNNTKSAELYIKLNGEMPSSLVSKSNVEEAVDTRDGNNFIVNTIGISKEDLLNYYFISGNYYTPFLKASNRQKVETISRFSKTDKIDKIIEEIKEEKTEDENYLNHKQREIDKIKTQQETYQEQIEHYKNEDFEKRRQEEINKIQEQLESLNSSINQAKKLIQIRKNEKKQYKENKKESESNLKTYQTNKETAEQKLKKVQDQISSEKYEQYINNYRQQINQLEKDLEDNKEQKSEVEDIKQELQTVLKGTITCPNCNHEFNPNNKETSIEEARESLQECKDIIQDLENNYISKDKEEIERINQEIEKIRNQEKEENEELRKQKRSLQNDIQNEDQKIASVNREIKDCDVNIEWKDKQIEKTQSQIEEDRQKVESKKQEIEQIKQKEYEDRSEELRKKLDDLKNQLKEKQKGYSQVEAKIADKEKWITRFEDFKFYLANKPIQAICNNINYYLKKARSDLSVEIEGFKRLKSGKIKQELTPQIYRSGLDPHPLGNFSGGERARINLCCDLAFQNILNQNSETGGMNFYQNDELLNPVDSLGIDNISKSMNELGKTIMLVTHSGADLLQSNVIKIVKENGISYVEK